MLLSMVVPCYNEQEAIPIFYQEFRKAVQAGGMISRSTLAMRRKRGLRSRCLLDGQGFIRCAHCGWNASQMQCQK